jgi:hypothetical protein
MVVWRRREENDWIYRAQTITERFVKKPEEYDEPTCGPGPFSMANADTTSAILLSAGFDEIALRRCDRPITMGRDLEEAVELVMSLGPAGEILRLAGERAAHLREPVAAALQDGMREWLGPDGVIAPASTWIVSASAPAASSSRPRLLLKLKPYARGVGQRADPPLYTQFGPQSASRPRSPATRLDPPAPVAQLDRASVYGTEGREFESLRARPMQRSYPPGRGGGHVIDGCLRGVGHAAGTGSFFLLERAAHASRVARG